MGNKVTIEMWNQRFSNSDYVYGKTENDFLRDISTHMRPGKTLCLADGEGRNGVFLAGLGHEVTSVDASTVALNKANMLARERNTSITTIVADLAQFTIEEEGWDTVVSIFCHLPVPLRRRLHQQVVQGLRPGGVFILEAYTPDQIPLATGGPRTEDLLMSLDDLRSELDGLVFEKAQEVLREINEGILHNGKSAVVQIVARKPNRK